MDGRQEELVPEGDAALLVIQQAHLQRRMVRLSASPNTMSFSALLATVPSSNLAGEISTQVAASRRASSSLPGRGTSRDRLRIVSPLKPRHTASPQNLGQKVPKE